MTFAERLKRKRLEAKLSQAELAERACVSVRTVQNYELGTRSPANMDRVRALAEALGTTQEFLLDEGDAGRRMEYSPAEVIALARGIFENPEFSGKEKMDFAKMLVAVIPHDIRVPAPTAMQREVRVQTFGYFEVFLGGKPLQFHRKKAKELFAFLVDRHGASVTTEQIAAVLWEDLNYDGGVKNMTTAIVSSLRTTLRENGLEHLLIKTWNALALDVSKISCDAYDFEKGDREAMARFRGEYMANYSWAEFAVSEYMEGRAGMK